MQTIEQPAHRIEEAQAPLWFGSGPATWGDVVRTVDPTAAHSAAEMIAAAGLDWQVEQHPLEAVVEHEARARAGAAPCRERPQRHARGARRRR